MPHTDDLTAPARGDDLDHALAFSRSLRASRGRRAAAARAARRRLRGRAGTLVLCGALALGGGTALAATTAGDDTPDASLDAGPSAATVKAAQRALGVPADGIVGPVTRGAIRRHQRAEGLKVTGRLDSATLSSLGLRAKEASTTPSGGGATAGEAPAKRKRTSGAPIPADLRATLERIAQCESGGDPRAVSADGTYRGKYQFSRATWRTVGGTGDPAAAPESEQDRRAAALYRTAGPSSWPNCA